MEILFWLSVCGVLYPYFGYPLLLMLLSRFSKDDGNVGTPSAPSVTMIVPVYNEEARIARKVANTASLDYDADRLQVLFVSDGSTDRTVEIIRAASNGGMTVVELPARRGKAAALNIGLEHAVHDIIVFSDASIELEVDALRRIVRRFGDARIGCVSGEDRIADAGGEGLYGSYELFLRRLESRVGSIVGASGSFYAQRRSLCGRFVEGMAPDFLSVLRSVERGFRAVSEPSAVGAMTSVKDPGQEFARKVRTLIRGMTTLFAHGRLLNPLRYGLFSLTLFSHKLTRWMVPFFLVALLVSALLLQSRWYQGVFAAQATFYLCAVAALMGRGRFRRSLPARVSLYFSMVNAAILAAWYQYLRGVRQELWTPSRR